MLTFVFWLWFTMRIFFVNRRSRFGRRLRNTRFNSKYRYIVIEGYPDSLLKNRWSDDTESRFLFRPAGRNVTVFGFSLSYYYQHCLSISCHSFGSHPIICGFLITLRKKTEDMQITVRTALSDWSETALIYLYDQIEGVVNYFHVPNGEYLKYKNHKRISSQTYLFTSFTSVSNWTWQRSM